MRKALPLLIVCLAAVANAFTTPPTSNAPRQLIIAGRPDRKVVGRTCLAAQISEKEASSAIDKVVTALRKDKDANAELGRLTKTNNILGFGSPRPGVIAVRFNASFQKGGMGRSVVPLPFGLGQSDKAEGRGTMVGQVKASVDAKTGKILDVSVFRDLGYGRSFTMKV